MPLPVSETVLVVPEVVLSKTSTLALCAPVLIGLKLILKVQFAPGARVLPHVPRSGIQTVVLDVTDVV
mgnify:FL=1